MADSAVSVLKAVIAALKANAGVAGLVGTRVYTDVPQASPFPYLVVSVQSEPFAANDFSGQSHQVRLQSFSRKQGSLEALNIRKAALDALDRHEEALTLEAGTLVKCEYSGLSDSFIEDDGKTWRAVGELQVVVV